MKTLYIILILLINLTLIGQNNCKCGKFYDDILQEPDTIIVINNDISFAICGYFENDFVSEFTVTRCGEAEILDFYSAVLKYKITVDKDTLKLIDFRFLLNDLKTYEITPWAIDLYYLNNKKIEHKRRVVYENNLSLNYNSEFQNAWDSEVKSDWSDNQKLIYWAWFISLNNKEVYENYFLNYRKVFKIGGVHAELYKELKIMYNEYKK